METSSPDPRIQPLEPGARVGPACGRPAWALSVLNYRPLNPKSQPLKSLYSEAWNFLHRQPGMGMALFSLLKQSVFRLFSRAADSHPLLWLMDF